MSDTPPVVEKARQPCFLVICRDRPGSAQLRQEHLNGHLAHVEKNWRRYVTAGPMREPGEDAIIGSVFLVLANSLDEAKTLMNGDPYLQCGMYESVEYKLLVNSIGQYIGGKIWESADAIRHRATGGPLEQS